MEGELNIRPARADDRQAMERFCAHTFDWGDYIPEVWDDWLADEQGLVIVGELAGHVVALSKITFHTPDQAWLAGMRVDPEYRRRGIAGAFLEYSLSFAHERGARVARLGTGHHNTAVHCITARAGMERVGCYAAWFAKPLPDSPPPEFLSSDQATQIQDFLQTSPVLSHCHGLYSSGWAWQELSTGRLHHLLGKGQIAAQFAPDGSLAAVAPVSAETHGEEMWVYFSDGDPSAVTSLAFAIRGYAAQIGAQRVGAMLPDVAWQREAFRAAGYGFGEWEGEMWVFERRWAGDSDDER
jgi:GNAT superfamily N-acetyltransferase